MSEILKELEEDLAKAKKRHAIFVKSFKHEESQGGKAITDREQRWLEEIAKNIAKLEKNIADHETTLNSISLQDISNKYNLLKNKTNYNYIAVQETHKEWLGYIYKVGLDYSAAYESFKSIMDAQSTYEADIANIAMSVVSVAGLGTLGWLFDSGKLIEKLALDKDKYQALIQVGEDMTQAGYDKVTGYIATKLPGKSSLEIDTPFAFQNKILLRALDNLIPISRGVLRYDATINVLWERATDLCMQPGGKEIGSKTAQAEYEHYLQMARSVTRSLQKVKSWTNTKPPSTIQGKARIDEFKRMFWQRWLPTLETIPPKENPSRRKQGMPLSPSYSNWWLSSAITNELDRLLDLDIIGVGEGGLDRWVSENDVRLLVQWAKTYTTKLEF